MPISDRVPREMLHDEGKIFGWGDATYQSGRKSYVIKTANVTIESCRRQYYEHSQGKMHVCAIGTKHTRNGVTRFDSACKGDSGSALLCKLPTHCAGSFQYAICGILSGVIDCGTTGKIDL